MSEDPGPSAAHNLARNLRSLRRARGLTQKRAAELAGVPRATWATMESGSSNPTLQVLLGAARALHTSLEELLGAPRATGRLYAQSSLPRKRRGKAEIRTLLPDPLPGVTLERLEIPPGSTLTGIPHTPGTREYLACETGKLKLTASGEAFELDPGDVVVFRGDQKHAYSALPGSTVVAYSIVLLAPG